MSRAIAAAGAAVLLVSLWLPFYRAMPEGASTAALFQRVGLPGPDPDRNTAWEVFAGLDIVLAALAVGILVVVFLRLPAVVAVLLAGSAAIVVVVRIASPVQFFTADDLVQVGALDRLPLSGFEPAWGAWVALAAALVTAAAALRAARS